MLIQASIQVVQMAGSHQCCIHDWHLYLVHLYRNILLQSCAKLLDHWRATGHMHGRSCIDSYMWNHQLGCGSPHYNNTNALGIRSESSTNFNHRRYA